MRILGVDSSLENRKLLKEYAGKWGYEIVLAKQGFEALKIIETEIFDLVLIGTDLQGLSGYEVCHKIKHNTNINNMSVVLLLEDNSKENRIHGYEVDADAFLSKPILVKELKALLSYFFNRKGKIKDAELCSEVAKTIAKILNMLIGEKDDGGLKVNYYNRLTNLLNFKKCTCERLKIVDCLYSEKWLLEVGKENKTKALNNLKMGAWLVPLLDYLYEYKNKDSKKEKLIFAGRDLTLEADILVLMRAFFELKKQHLNNTDAIKVLRIESEEMGYNENVLDKLEEIGRTEDLLVALQV